MHYTPVRGMGVSLKCSIFVLNVIKLLASKEWEKGSTEAHSPGPEDPGPPARKLEERAAR